MGTSLYHISYLVRQTNFIRKSACWMLCGIKAASANVHGAANVALRSPTPTICMNFRRIKFRSSPLDKQSKLESVWGNDGLHAP